MAYNLQLAQKLRKRLSEISGITVEEKKMFGGLAFMVNGKMCINVSNDGLMCRFHPENQEALSKKKGYQKMIMNGKEYKGFRYVQTEGFRNKKDFDFWVNLCLEYNEKAPVSKKKK